MADSNIENVPVDNEFEKLIEQQEYSKALEKLDKKTEKEDSNIYYKRGICFFYLDNYQFALVNFRKDRKLNGEEHKMIDEMFEKMDNIFDEEDSLVTTEIIDTVLKNESDKNTAIIKLYSSDNFRKRRFWFGYFNNNGKETYSLFDSETKSIQYLEEKIFAQKFKANYYVNYEEQRPLFSVNDSSEYPH